MCLTATLTQYEQESLIRLLKINPTIVKASPYRENIFYSLQNMTELGSNIDSVFEQIFRDTLSFLVDSPDTAPTTLVFCRSYQSLVRVYVWLERKLVLSNALYKNSSPQTAGSRVLAQYHGVTDEMIKSKVLKELEIIRPVP